MRAQTTAQLYLYRSLSAIDKKKKPARRCGRSRGCCSMLRELGEPVNHADALWNRGFVELFAFPCPRNGGLSLVDVIREDKDVVTREYSISRNINTVMYITEEGVDWLNNLWVQE